MSEWPVCENCRGIDYICAVCAEERTKKLEEEIAAYEERWETTQAINQKYRSFIDDMIYEIEKKGDHEWARNIRCDLWFIDTLD